MTQPHGPVDGKAQPLLRRTFGDTIRSALDASGVQGRKQARSKYGAKKAND